MSKRALSPIEAANLAKLNACQLESVLLFLTRTGFEKSICDATAPIRAFFFKNGVHDYSQQGQGTESKVVKDIVMLHTEGFDILNVSLYRPVTKKGDPRLWIANSKKYLQGDHVLAFFVYEGNLHAANLSTLDFSSPFVSAYFAEYLAAKSAVAIELLGILKEIAKKPIPATCKGSTAIGRSVETALGIAINSSHLPDYKGIELKAKREGSGTRNSLFACVPDWKISHCKSSSEILDTFGYWRESVFRLYCTVSTKHVNSQNLVLSVDEVGRLLNELHRTNLADNPVAIWRLETLEKKLQQKHNETFWINATTEIVKGMEYFRLNSVMHTRRPNVPQFERLLSSGDITLDHLIKRKEKQRVVEKGPFFKIASSKIPELFFGQPETYTLI